MKATNKMAISKMAFSIGLCTALLAAGCHSTDTEPNGAHSDSLTINEEPAMAPGEVKGDSLSAPDTNTTATMPKMTDSMSKMTTGKRKGKVTIVMDNTPKTGSMEADKDGFYSNVEVLPGYPGGQSSLEKFFENNIQYPAEAVDQGVEGLVQISFAVDENGKVYEPKMVNQKIGYGIEEEALRVFKKMPTWTPGKIKGKNVKSRFTLPVRFQLT